MAIPREPQSLGDSVETTRQLPKQITKAYMLGLLHDATERKTTYRIGQKNKQLIQSVAKFIKKFGCGAWIYKEGKDRDMYILEFSKSFLVNTKIKSLKNKIDFVSAKSYKRFAKIIGSCHPEKSYLLGMKI